MKKKYIAPLLAVGVGALLAGGIAPASAAGKLPRPDIQKGSYFSKAYGVSVEDTSTRAEWSEHWVTKGGKRVKWKNHDSWKADKLAPGTYVMHRKTGPYKDDLPRTLTWGDVWDWDSGYSGSVSYAREDGTYYEDGYWWDYTDVTATFTVRHKRSGAVYTGTVSETDPYWDGDSFYYFEDEIPDETVLTRTVAPKWAKPVHVKRTFTVKARNGGDVTTREAKAIKIGMPMEQVHRIFGTAGRNGLKSSGFSVRHYDDWVTIGYSNGRVQSIQRY